MSYLAPVPSPASQDDAAVDTVDLLPAAVEAHWTPPKMAEFLRQLSATQSVAAAARSVGMGRQSAYKLRARLKGQPFDLAWQCAIRRTYDALAEAALDRALHGVEVPHFHKGELVHTSRRYDERLTVALLAMRGALAPTPYGAGAYNPESLPADDFERLVRRVEDGPERWR